MENVIKKFNQAPNCSIVFYFGKGFICNGIRIFQKIESIETAARLSQERNINWNMNTPTHCVAKIEENTIISADPEGVVKKEINFKKLLKKDILLCLAEPSIEDEKAKKWQSAAMRFLEIAKNHQPYDYFGFFSFIYRIISKIIPIGALPDYDWEWASFCSELCAEMFTDIKYGDLLMEIEEDPSCVSPEELFLKSCQSENINMTPLIDKNNHVANLIEEYSQNV